MKNKGKIKKTASLLTFSFVSVATILVVFVFVVLAWFSLKPEGSIDSIVVTVEGGGKEKVKVVKINNNDDYDRYKFYPGDIIVLDLLVVENISSFGVRLDSRKLSNTDHLNIFSNRNDLLLGMYQQEERYGATSKYFDFDIDGHLNNYFSGSGLSESELITEKNKSKYKFFKKFTDNQANNILQAMKVTVVDIDGTPVEIEMVQDNVTYSSHIPPSTSTEFDNGFIAGTTLKILIEYCNLRFIPDEIQVDPLNPTGTYVQAVEPFMEWTATDGLEFPLGKYKALNYNCFIGQEIPISFMEPIKN